MTMMREHDIRLAEDAAANEQAERMYRYIQAQKSAERCACGNPVECWLTGEGHAGVCCHCFWSYHERAAPQPEEGNAG